MGCLVSWRVGVASRDAALFAHGLGMDRLFPAGWKERAEGRESGSLRWEAQEDVLLGG